MKNIEIDNHVFKVNPNNLPFMTGFTKSLGEIFMKPNDEVSITKQILLIGSHYCTFSKIKTKDEEFWSWWNDKLILYNKSEYEGPDIVYYYNDKEVGRSAFLCESKYYSGTVHGIFANDDNGKMKFMMENDRLHKYITFLDNNSKYYYICYYSSTYRDNQFSYVLKHIN